MQAMHAAADKTHAKMPQPKPAFVKRMEALLGADGAKEFFGYITGQRPPASLRCNTIKMQPAALKQRLEEKGWRVSQPIAGRPEMMLVEVDKPSPHTLGNTMEHMLGYYYVQGLSSMMPVIAMDARPGERLLDLCAAPGSKATQAAAAMGNSGFMLANDISIHRIKALSANLERCGVANAVVMIRHGQELCRLLAVAGITFDKALVDAPCSGEGIAFKFPAVLETWGMERIRKLSGLQKQLAAGAAKALAHGGEMVYSTCTLAPEEDEAVVDFLVSRCGMEAVRTRLPLESRPGITSWEGADFSEEVAKAHRIYPHESNSEGFFICKLRNAA